METLTLKGIKRNGSIEVGRTIINVPHLEGILTFLHPAIGPGTYNNVMGQVTKDELLRPTSSQTLSLVDLAYQNRDSPYIKDVADLFIKKYLWSATENLSILKNGIIVYDNINGEMPQTSKKLLEMYESKDQRVRLVPYGFKTGSQEVSDFVRNPYVIAQFGEGQMDLVARVAERFKLKPWVNAVQNVDRETKRYTALGSLWGGGRLCVDGAYHGGDDDGYAFGVRNTGEASHTQK